ncbi:Flap endonuclease [Lachnellula willkommii]|uniref:Flap endonuclease n=1 Tax=Lachnellula willkommii TaxID=215461 RepID=A0A559M8Y0_9HELO|nr:Flap endonuclease [Lachnellula willkommii]
MGIGYIWDILEEYEDIENIADFAAESLAKKKRPLRIAVDEPYWRYKNVQPDEAEEIKRKLLDKLGVVCWDAPGEAEAECARMQMLGLVDAVWTEEADAFMFGSNVVTKFHYDAPKRKNKDCFKVYDLNKIQKIEPCLSHESFLLHSVLTGNEERFMDSKNIGKDEFLVAAKKQLGIWVKEIDEEALKKLLVEKFLLGAKDYVKWIVQFLVVRTLMRVFTKESTEAGDKYRGQEQNMECYELRLASSRPKMSKSPSLLNATFLVAAATTVDLAAWAEEDNKHAAKKYIVPERFTVRTLRCLLEQAEIAQPEAEESPRAQRSPANYRASASVPRKRQQSPELGADATPSRASKKAKGKAPIRNSISDFFQRQPPVPQLPEGSQIASLSMQATAKALEDPKQAETSSRQATLNLNVTKAHVSHPSSRSTAGMSNLQKNPPVVSDSGKWTRDVSPTPGPSRPPQAHRTSYMDLTGEEDEFR